ncbi:hypothetical protein CRUP_003973 [Coryphaenoides rupestris]|nr:hypothetical protein CRUP_003973 [Coryphaenoides rupestris]
MAGDCTYNHTARYDSAGRAGRAGGHWKGRGRLLPPPPPHSPHFEVIDGLLYRKKLERGFLNYREVLGEERRREAISTFHRRRRADGAHLSFEETYRCVAENYWWDGFSEESLLPLLDFSYSSTLRVRRENLQEVSAMARHLGMWPALEACSALLREQQQQTASPTAPTLRCSRTGPGDSSPPSSPCELQRDRKRKRFSSPETEVQVEDGFSLALDPSPCRRVTARSDPRLFGGPPQGTPPQNGGLHVQSPTHTRMKLMDFKSPSCKKKAPASRATPATPPRHAAPVQSRSFTPPPTLAPLMSTPPLPSPHARLLRSTPGAAQEVQRLQPRPESPRKYKRRPEAVPRRRLPPTTTAAHATPSSSLPPRRRRSSRAGGAAVSPAPRVKQEPHGGGSVGEDDDDEEEDYERAQEKYRLMMVLGLQRTALLPRPEDLVGWRQKKRLRKLKANNYCLTKRRTPRPGDPEERAFGRRRLPLCDVRFLGHVVKAEPADRLICGGEEEEEVGVRRRPTPHTPRPRGPPPSDRSMRSRGAPPAPPPPSSPPPSPRPRPRPRAVLLSGGRELRSSPRRAQSTPLRTIPASATFRMIKAEPMDFFISGPPPPSNSHHRDDGKPALRAAPHYNGRRPRSTAKPRHVPDRRGAPRQGEEKEEGGRGGGQRSLKAVHDGGRPPGLQADKPDGLEASVPAATMTPPPPSVYSHPLYKVIKEEPADPLPVAGPHHPASPDHLGKRQSKPPIKLLDPGFLFSFCRPGGGGGGGGGGAVVKREEESVDICLTRSVSREKFSATPTPRVLRPRDGSTLSPSATRVRVKPEQVERSVSHGRGQQRARSQPHHHNRRRATTSATSSPRHQAKHTQPKATQGGLKRQQGGALASSSRRCPLPESPRHSRLKHLRPPGPSPLLRHPHRADPWGPGGHTCLQCHAPYRDCLALLMHQLHHVDGKHWPCPLCSKTFFWLRNVRKHVRTHDQKLYKCRSCLPSSSS